MSTSTHRGNSQGANSGRFRFLCRPVCVFNGARAALKLAVLAVPVRKKAVSHARRFAPARFSSQRLSRGWQGRESSRRAAEDRVTPWMWRYERYLLHRARLGGTLFGG